MDKHHILQEVELSTPQLQRNKIMVSLGLPSHTLYLLTFAPQRHSAGQEVSLGSANELLCCVFVCAQLGVCGCGKQVPEEDGGFIMW